MANNTRKPLWGYKSIVYSMLFLSFMSFIVWAHHMYLTGMGTTMSAFFQTTTMIISIPSVIILTALILSLWGASIRFSVPMLFALAFLPMFGIGGLTGLPLGLTAPDIHLHDTYYVIGHFHYVVAPGTLFALFAGVYYWYPKATGRKMSTFLGHLHFWPSLIFMNGIFFPMLVQGRRFYEPVAGGLELLAAWGGAGFLDDETLRRLGESLSERLPQVSSVTIAEGTAPEAEGLQWTKPAILSTTGQLGVTASVAFEGQAGRPRRVTAEVLLEELTRYAREIEVSERGSLWLLSEDSRLLAWPEDEALWRDRDPRKALLELPRELGLPLVEDATEAFVRSQTAGRTDPVRFVSSGEDWWGLVRPFSLAAQGRLLIIVVVVPHADLLTDRTRLMRWVLILALAALAVAVARAATVALRVSRPIEALVEESGRISRGDLEPGRAIVSELAEVRELADAHQQMRGGLKTLMKLERDLQIAHQIQQRTFPSELPRLAGFDLAAWNRPADETGGDSYDVIGLDDDGAIVTGEAGRAVLMLADATGHGVGPALSVTQLRAMLRMAVRTGAELVDLATHINDQLYADLHTNRFITAWLGILDVGAAALTTLSAGQAPLLYYRAAGDEVEDRVADTPPLGLLPALPRPQPGPLRMQPGDHPGHGVPVVVRADGDHRRDARAQGQPGFQLLDRVLPAVRQQPPHHAGLHDFPVHPWYDSGVMSLNYRQYIVQDPKVCGGEPTVRATRVTVRTVLASLGEGATIHEILEDFPSLDEEAVRAVIAFAALSTAEDLPIRALPAVS